MRISLLCLAGMLALAGCSDATLVESEIVHNQIGRWSITPAQNGYPAILLDSATGCTMIATLTDKGELILAEAKYPNGEKDCNAVLQLPTVDSK